MKNLSDAIEFAETVNPLPRCKHNACLRDGAGELLEPPCGCRFRDTRKLAERIVEKMFTNGAGEKADRLVLVKDNDRDGHSREPYRDLGGYSKSALVDLVTRELESEEA